MFSDLLELLKLKKKSPTVSRRRFLQGLGITSTISIPAAAIILPSEVVVEEPEPNGYFKYEMTEAMNGILRPYGVVKCSKEEADVCYVRLPSGMEQMLPLTIAKRYNGVVIPVPSDPMLLWSGGDRNSLIGTMPSRLVKETPPTPVLKSYPIPSNLAGCREEVEQG